MLRLWLLYTSRTCKIRPTKKNIAMHFSRPKRSMMYCSRTPRGGAICGADGISNPLVFPCEFACFQWLCELRSSPAGHPCYRILHRRWLAKYARVFPAFERFFKFVDYDGYEFGRLTQEQRKIDKQQTLLI